MRVTLSILASISFIIPGIAQQSAPPPKFPLTLRAPQASSWTVVCAQTGEKPDKPVTAPYVQTLVVQKSYPFYHEIATVANGKSWEKWIIFDKSRDFQFIKYTGDPGWSRMSTGGYESDSSDYSGSDFEDLQWADASTYKGAVKFGDGNAFLFETKVGNRRMTKKEAAQFDYGRRERQIREGVYVTNDSTVSALFDMGTLLPLKYDKGYEVFTYAFGAVPVGLKPPAEVASDYNKWLAEIAARNR